MRRTDRVILIADNGRNKPNWVRETDGRGIERGAVRIFQSVEDPERPGKTIPDYSTVFDEVELLDHIGGRVLRGIEQLTDVDRVSRLAPPEALRAKQERAFERFIYRGELFDTEQYARYMFPERMRKLDHALRPLCKR